MGAIFWTYFANDNGASPRSAGTDASSGERIGDPQLHACVIDLGSQLLESASESLLERATAVLSRANSSVRLVSGKPGGSA